MRWRCARIVLVAAALAMLAGVAGAQSTNDTER